MISGLFVVFFFVALELLPLLKINLVLFIHFVGESLRREGWRGVLRTKLTTNRGTEGGMGSLVIIFFLWLIFPVVYILHRMLAQSGWAEVNPHGGHKAWG